MSNYRLFVNAESTVLVRIWPDGPMEVAVREHASHTWGPPVLVHEEGTSAASGDPVARETTPLAPASEQGS